MDCHLGENIYLVHATQSVGGSSAASVAPPTAASGGSGQQHRRKNKRKRNKQTGMWVWHCEGCGVLLCSLQNLLSSH